MTHVWSMILAASSVFRTAGPFQNADRRFVYGDLEESDIEGVRSVALASTMDAYRDILGQAEIERVLDDAYSRARLLELADLARAGATCFVVARLGSSVVGFVAGDQEGTGMVMHRLYVHPNYQGLGVGGGLVRQWEQFVTEHGESSYHAFVHEQAQQAIDFYLRAGFVHRPECDIEGHWMIERRIPSPESGGVVTRIRRLAQSVPALFAHLKH